MTKKMVHLTFPETLIQEPVVYQLGHKFDVVTSIFRASVGEEDAWLVLEMDGEEEEILRSMEFLRGLGLRVEERSESEI